jgi:hypothetical protein
LTTLSIADNRLSDPPLATSAWAERLDAKELADQRPR